MKFGRVRIHWETPAQIKGTHKDTMSLIGAMGGFFKKALYGRVYVRENDLTASLPRRALITRAP